MAPSLYLLRPATYTPISCSLNPPNDSTKSNDRTELKCPPNPNIKVPTPPWMKGPLLLQPGELLSISNRPRNKNSSREASQMEKSDLALTGKEGGVRGGKVMKKIVKSIERLRFSKGLVGIQEEKSDGKLMPWEKGEEKKLNSNKGLAGIQVESDGFELGVGKSMPWKRGEETKLNSNKGFVGIKEESSGFELGGVGRLMPWEKKEEKLLNSNKGFVGNQVESDAVELGRGGKLMPWKMGEEKLLNLNKGFVGIQVECDRLELGGGGKSMPWDSGEEKLLNLNKGFVANQVESDGVELGGDERKRKMMTSKLMPWERGVEKLATLRVKKERVVTKAELSLDRELLWRLREEAKGMKKKVKWVMVKKAGVTQDVVNEIRLLWKKSELVMVKFDVPLCRSMARAREILEIKTGGMVVWTRKDAHIIYKGVPKASSIWKKGDGKSMEEESSQRDMHVNVDARNQLGPPLFERETDRLLDGLGPRFEDWWMRKPLPVDGDRLPEFVPGFTSPSRRCPPCDISTLRDDELTYLRKLARALPTHFVLGRNRRLQGLAAAILKLWKKSVIAKIAIKWGVPNTDNEQMANELKLLTGGTVLLRDKFYIVLYRGKDFLNDKVVEVIKKRESELHRCHLNEENARLKSSQSLFLAEEAGVDNARVGTLSEFQDLQIRYQDMIKLKAECDLGVEAEREKLKKELRSHEFKLSILEKKIEKSESQLKVLHSAWRAAESDPDSEMMTEEERECFRKIGIKLQGTLVLGRRGIFDGVLEGLHQHWKHKEVVKVITMQKTVSQVHNTAKLLEAESGGILVSVEKLKEGHAIIIYRGKNYKRPRLSYDNLLTKREALRRSLLLQRIGSLKFFAYKHRRAISQIKSNLEELQQSDQNTPEIPLMSSG